MFDTDTEKVDYRKDFPPEEEVDFFWRKEFNFGALRPTKSKAGLLGWLL